MDAMKATKNVENIRRSLGWKAVRSSVRARKSDRIDGINGPGFAANADPIRSPHNMHAQLPHDVEP
jgi:hypothetical protein